MHGYTVVETLRDIGVSAYKGRNSSEGALQGCLDRVERGEIEPGAALLVESPDRLSREQVLDALGLFLRILSLNVRVITLGDGYEYTRESANNIGGLAELELVFPCAAAA